MRKIRCSCRRHGGECQHTLLVSTHSPTLSFLEALEPRAYIDLDNQGLLALYEELQRLVVDRELLAEDNSETPSRMALARELNRGRFYIGEEPA